jgi:hypothetical protein
LEGSGRGESNGGAVHAGFHVVGCSPFADLFSLVDWYATYRFYLFPRTLLYVDHLTAEIVGFG